MPKKVTSFRLNDDVLEYYDTLSAIGDVNRTSIVEGMTYMLIEKHGIQSILDYITALEFKDGRKK